MIRQLAMNMTAASVRATCGGYSKSEWSGRSFCWAHSPQTLCFCNAAPHSHCLRHAVQILSKTEPATPLMPSSAHREWEVCIHKLHLHVPCTAAACACVRQPMSPLTSNPAKAAACMQLQCCGCGRQSKLTAACMPVQALQAAHHVSGLQKLTAGPSCSQLGCRMRRQLLPSPNRCFARPCRVSRSS